MTVATVYMQRLATLQSESPC